MSKVIKFFLLPIFFVLFCSSCHRAGRYKDLAITEIQKGNILIVIDPGHGGKDAGAASYNKKLHEKHFCLSTGLLLQKHLRKMGYATLITREDDAFVTLNKRAQIANKADAALFVSIHYNAAKNRNARGLEVFYNDYPGHNNRAEKSKELAENILTNMVPITKEPSRGVKPAAFVVLVNTTMPAVLVEGGFLTNRQDLEKIKRASYWDKAALGIARGIDSYVCK